VTPGRKMIFPIVTLQQVLTHLSDMMTAEEKEKMNFQSTQPSETSPKAVETHEEDKGLAKMPDLRGLSLRKSLRLLKATPLEIRVQGTGRVTAQSPPAGTVLTGVKECSITLQPMVNKNRPSKEITKSGKKSEGGGIHETGK